jgi:hypothetical protein
MKVLVLAGLITAATAPFAMAADSEIECQGETRRAPAEQRLDAPPPAPGAAAATPARPTVAQREAPDTQRPAATERRRNGKRIPDAELIGPRGAL